jgi:hypothetical protein
VFLVFRKARASSQRLHMNVEAQQDSILHNPMVESSEPVEVLRVVRPGPLGPELERLLESMRRSTAHRFEEFVNATRNNECKVRLSASSLSTSVILIRKLVHKRLEDSGTLSHHCKMRLTSFANGSISFG